MSIDHTPRTNVAGLDISFVISLIGSTAGATLQFVLPACMLITLGMPCKGFLFMIFGILFGVLGTCARWWMYGH